MHRHSSEFVPSALSEKCSLFVCDLFCVFVLQNRAQAATELLQELNSDVSGNFVEEVGIVYVPKQSYMLWNMCFVMMWQHEYTKTAKLNLKVA